MPRIFISYRRSDSQDVAGRIYDRLADYFGKQNVFMDLDSIHPGQDYGDVIGESIRRADAVVVIIGPSWTTTLSDQGTPRLDDPGDMVRQEVEKALGLDLQLIPTLVGGARTPSIEELPESLQPLLRLNTLSVRSGPQDFRRDMDRLVSTIAGCPMHPLAGQARNGKGRGMNVIVNRSGCLMAITLSLVFAVLGVCQFSYHYDGTSVAQRSSLEEPRASEGMAVESAAPSFEYAADSAAETWQMAPGGYERFDSSDDEPMYWSDDDSMTLRAAPSDQIEHYRLERHRFEHPRASLRSSLRASASVSDIERELEKGKLLHILAVVERYFAPEDESERGRLREVVIGQFLSGESAEEIFKSLNIPESEWEMPPPSDPSDDQRDLDGSSPSDASQSENAEEE